MSKRKKLLGLLMAAGMSVAIFTAESANLAAQYHAPYHQLCAVKLSLIHPITGKTLEIACTPDFSVDILFHL